MSRSENHGRFAWHELLTTDTEAAKRFYTEVVGWKAQAWGDGSIPYTVFLNGETPAAGLMKLPQEAAAMGAPPNWLAYVEVDDADATIAQATKLGATLLGDAMTMEGVGRFAVLRDPQGAVFAVLTSARELAPETDPAPLEFSWHELITADHKAAVQFYEALFGWKKQDEFDMGPMGTYYMFGRDRFTYGGMFTKGADMPVSTWLYYAQVPGSADAAAERATKAGAKIFNGPMEVPGGDRIAAMFDPQGAAFAVHSKAAVSPPAAPPSGSPARHAEPESSSR